MGEANGALVIMKCETFRHLYRLKRDVISSGAVSNASNNNRRRHVVQVKLDVVKSSKDGIVKT